MWLWVVGGLFGLTITVFGLVGVVRHHRRDPERGEAHAAVFGLYTVAGISIIGFCVSEVSQWQEAQSLREKSVKAAYDFLDIWTRDTSDHLGHLSGRFGVRDRETPPHLHLYATKLIQAAQALPGDVNLVGKAKQIESDLGVGRQATTDWLKGSDADFCTAIRHLFRSLVCACEMAVDLSRINGAPNSIQKLPERCNPLLDGPNYQWLEENHPNRPGIEALCENGELKKMTEKATNFKKMLSTSNKNDDGGATKSRCR